MKLYLFDSETGLYLGQDFGDKADINISEGITDLTPPNYDHGETPVFDFKNQKWTVIETDKVRPMLFEKMQGLK
ncbi:MAG: hypothetical protein CXR30_16650 [Geobacter sp.]|nr:MAG: hypothetical protein CXR30_16650 [Geobacter sp.]